MNTEILNGDKGSTGNMNLPGKYEKFAYVVLIMMGIILRFYKLNMFNPDLTYTSIRYAVLLDEIFQGQHCFPRGPEMCEFDETLILYLTYPFARIFGLGLTFLRTFSAVLSLSVLPAVYYFVRKQFNERCAWISMVFVSTSIWFIYSAHVYHRIRYDLGIACTITAIALLMDNSKGPVVKGLLASILSGFALYLHSSNAVLIICAFIFLLFKGYRKSKHSLKTLIAYSTIMIVIIHSGFSIQETNNRKAQHLIRFKPVLKLIENTIATKTDVKIQQKIYKIKAPKLKYGKKPGYYLFLRNISRIPAEFLWLPIDSYLQLDTFRINNPLLGLLILLGTVLFLMRQDRRKEKPLFLIFLVWLFLQSLLRPNPVETLYYNPGVVMSVILGAITVVKLPKLLRVNRRFQILGIVILVTVSCSCELIRSKVYMDKMTQKQTPRFELYCNLLKNNRPVELNTPTTNIDPISRQYLELALNNTDSETADQIAANN